MERCARAESRGLRTSPRLPPSSPAAGAAPPSAHKPRPGGPALSQGCGWLRSLPSWGPGSLRTERLPPAPNRRLHGGAAHCATRVGATAGRRSRRCSGAGTPAAPGTRDGGAAVQRPPAAGRLRAREVTPRAERAGRIRGGRGGGSGYLAALCGRAGADPTLLALFPPPPLTS